MINLLLIKYVKFGAFFKFQCVCVFVCQRWSSKFPHSIRWVPLLFDSVATRAALRLLLVILCLLLTLLMAVLNIVSQQSEKYLHKHEL